LDQQPGGVNYYIGNDPAQWHTDVPLYARVQYRDVYPGIDLIYYGTSQRQLEYDFVVSPGADPGTIRLALAGANGIDIDAQGNLVLHTALGDVMQHAPVMYQEVNGVRQAVSGAFALDSVAASVPLAVVTTGTVVATFHVGDYDPSLPLVIDPVQVYS